MAAVAVGLVVAWWRELGLGSDRDRGGGGGKR